MKKSQLPFFLLLLLMSWINTHAWSQKKHLAKNQLKMELSCDDCWKLVEHCAILSNKTNDTIHRIDGDYPLLESGMYTLRMSDAFRKNYSITFNLKKDTILDLKKIMGYTPVFALSVADMEAANQIEIVYAISGCFTDYHELDIFKKKPQGNVYRLDQYTDYEKENRSYKDSIAPDILNELYRLQMVSNGIEKNKGRSTTTHYWFILAGNKLYSFNDGYTDGWNLYEPFIREALKGAPILTKNSYKKR